MTQNYKLAMPVGNVLRCYYATEAKVERTAGAAPATSGWKPDTLLLRHVRLVLVEAQGIEPYRQIPCKGIPWPTTAPNLCSNV